MSAFDDETAVAPVAPGRWGALISPAWRIGEHANGGYALTPVLRALRELSAHSDPLSVTAHFLRPVLPGAVVVDGQVVRAGRTATTVRAGLSQDGTQRLEVVAVFGDLGVAVGRPETLTLAPPELPPPDACVHRSQLAQGVELPILDRLDVRLHPDRAAAGRRREAVMEGWIRFVDGTEPSVLSLPLFADAFPPAVAARWAAVGWVPTLELTVHVRRRPVPGWIRARFECDDLDGGRMIETGSLWDASGALVARSRQLGLVMAR